MVNNVLSSIYYDTSKPGSYGGVESLFKEAVKVDSTLTRKKVKDWLEGQLVYTLNKQARRHFKRNPVIAEHINENFQADLVDMQEFAKYNNGYRYILTVIDVFSKHAWAIPIKNKQASSVRDSMKEILKNVIPYKVQTDRGKEFDNELFRKLMDDYEINFFMTKNKEIKCSIVERFNRTLKNKLHKYFTKIGKGRYIDVLDSILKSYNKSYHRSIKMAPIDVREHNEEEVFENLYGYKSKREILRKFKKPSLKTGDKVRKKYTLGPLDRGYYRNWTDEVYTIDKAMKNLIKPLHFIKASNGQVLKQRFYPEEVQKINDKNIYRVEKVLSEKIVRGVKYFKVKWVNYPSTENSWIKADDLLNIGDGE